MSWTDALGYAASASVLGTFCMTRMLPLRLLALLSNMLFASYGFAEHLYPVLILHTLLFPVNLVRLCEARQHERETPIATGPGRASLPPSRLRRAILRESAADDDPTSLPDSSPKKANGRLDHDLMTPVGQRLEDCTCNVRDTKH